MGLILDSSVLIAAERQGQNARQIVIAILWQSGKHRDRPFGHSHRTRPWCGACGYTAAKRNAATVHSGTAHGAAIYPVMAPLALRVGQIDGESQSRGIRVPFADLLIGVTALELGYSLATANPRHFERIPGLSVVRF